MAVEKPTVAPAAETYEVKIEKTAKNRADYTRNYFKTNNKDLAKFCEELKKPAYKIEINPDDDKSLALGIVKLQKILKFPEEDNGLGADGKYGIYTNLHFMKEKFKKASQVARDIVLTPEQRAALPPALAGGPAAAPAASAAAPALAPGQAPTAAPAAQQTPPPAPAAGQAGAKPAK